jgi:hypothetical protein
VRLAGIRRAHRRSRPGEDGGRVYGPQGLGLGGCLALGGGRRGCSAAPPCGVHLELASGELSAGVARGVARRGYSRAAARGRSAGYSGNRPGHDAAAADANSTSTACAWGEADRGRFVGGEKGRLHCDKTRGTLTPVRVTRCLRARALGMRDVLGRREHQGEQGPARARAGVRWRGASAARRARVGAPGECFCVGLTPFDHALLQNFE